MVERAEEQSKRSPESRFSGRIGLLLDAAIPEKVIEDPRASVRARVLVWVIFVFGFVCLGMLVVFAIFPLTGSELHQSMSVVLPATGLGLVAITYALFRWVGSISLAGHFGTASSLVLVLIAIGQTGGLHSALIPYLAVMPVVAAVVLRGTAVLFWFFVSSMCFCGLFFLHHSGVTFGVQSTPEDFEKVMFLVGIMVCAMVASVLMVYENLNTELRNGLGQERERYADLAARDPLTGIANRNTVMDRLSASMARAERLGKQLALLYIDLDGFKLINDRLGHHVGDVVLREFATRLRACVRASDTVGRVGGDEFIVLLEDLKSTTDVEAATRNLIREVGGSFEVDAHLLNVGLSIGISIYPDSAQEQNLMVSLADSAMYRAKQTEEHFWVHRPE